MILPNYLTREANMEARFIQSQHPRHSIAPTADQVRSLIKLGWIGQPKMNGHRLQLHIGPEGQLIAYTRHGRIHSKPLSTELEASFAVYASQKGWTTLEGEWLKGLGQVHLFDVLRFESDTLILRTYEERYQILKDIFQLSPSIKLIRVLKKFEDCMQVLTGTEETVEGLVFKSWTTKGWPDTAIVRCLKEGIRA